ncbi:DEAD/DEAH box helicase [Sphingobacterium deserti]|uniref:Type III restriction protein res subunit n=1 Tax=Sphingobacterium deserti TaxID=1229276 RepID=A0A0B8T6E2_9SPHI|nr:DEAD/DEAH box helicase [Sphingobacterium deserti]KGE12725.1 type III restriction protein res subunit [Sphingobacterium deserti]
MQKQKPYYYQQHDIDLLFEKMTGCNGHDCRMLYQLPTGGGKTVIFSAIARDFIKAYGKKVVILTHRAELCKQTSKALQKSAVANKVIDSAVKRIGRKEGFSCYVAMVETLKRRINDGLFDTRDVGLVIVDEAHHNSFRKLLSRFKNAAIIGVTATPLSSDVNLPLRDFYTEIVIGQSISNLIAEGYLARPIVREYDVELNTLRTGNTGDFTIGTSDALYGSDAMINLLLEAYRAHAVKKKTVIFNSGIITSKKIAECFHAEGYPVKHLDNKTSARDRAEILRWFKKTKGAILTSVSLLTVGFDEPTIQTVILNRATTSITLYHQMIGRGARRLSNKRTFQIIDLGNNTERFGAWDKDIDWQQVFEHPEQYVGQIHESVAEIRQISPELRAKFPASLEVNFDIFSAYKDTLARGEKVKNVIRDAIRQHAKMCTENAHTITEALALTDLLDKEIDLRVKDYVKCLGNVTREYSKWLTADYKERLKKIITRYMYGRRTLPTAV